MIINKTESNELEQLVKKVISKTPFKKKYELTTKDVVITDCYDSRTFFECDGNEFTIRMWDIENINGGKQGRIRWTLFLDVPDEDGGSHGEELSSGISLVDYDEPQMEYKYYPCNINRTYDMGVMTHEFFYDNDSINDRFRDFLKEKYEGRMDIYIKPYGSFGNNGDYVTSFVFYIRECETKEHNKAINSITVHFQKLENHLYVLEDIFEGCKTKDGYELLNEVILFMDCNFPSVKTA
jgi:hypothetical protein